LASAEPISVGTALWISSVHYVELEVEVYNPSYCLLQNSQNARQGLRHFAAIEKGNDWGVLWPCHKYSEPPSL